MNRFLLLAAFFMAALYANGQKALQFQLGARVGANYANFHALRNSNILNHKNNTFIMAGLYGELRILNTVGLRAEVLSNPKGSLINYYDTNNNVNVEAIRRLNYTDVTLSAAVYFNLFKVLNFYAFGGYSFESLGKAQDAVQNAGGTTKTITNEFERNANSIIGGLGLELRLGSIAISPEIRYAHGLTDVMKTNIETKNKVWTASVGLGYFF